MWRRIRQVLGITAVRLSIAYTLAFGLLAIILVIYMTSSAVDFLAAQFRDEINKEVASLQLVYQRRGLNGLIRDMEFRSRGPGANLYVVSDRTGRVVAGNVREIEPHVLSREGWVMHPFPYVGYGDEIPEDDDEYSRAVARNFTLPNGMIIMVGKDIGEPERFRRVVGRAISFSMAMMLIAGFLIWLFVGRRALKRIDMVSKSTERIMAGDRAERLPVTGSNDEFDRLSVRMNNMLDNITDLDRGLRDVADSIAHDLKTPLTRLRNKVEAALSKDPGETQAREVLQEVLGESDQIIKTFNALLMISRVESGSQVAELHPISLSELARDAAELYEPVFEDAGFQLRLEVADGVSVRGSRELLSQAISNLLDNALKYGQAENDGTPEILLGVKTGGKKTILQVSDNGPGIPEDQTDRVRRRFERLDKSRSKPGTGLGLALVEAVAKLHGGELELLDNQPGLSARLVLPAI